MGRTVEIMIPAGEQEITDLLAPAAEAVRQGEIVIFPTETVYGIGARADIPEAVEKIYRAKQRPKDKPFAYHVGSWEMIERIMGIIPPAIDVVLRRYLPGPFTFLVNAGGEKAGIRFPSHPVARQFLELCAVPVVATSANVSGQASPVTAEMTYAMWGWAAWCINAGPTERKLDSTIVDLTAEPPVCLRQGSIPWKE